MTASPSPTHFSALPESSSASCLHYSPLQRYPPAVTFFVAIGIVAMGLAWLLVLVVPKVYDYLKRNTVRKRHNLESLRLGEDEKPPSRIPDNRFGFEVIYSIVGLQETDPDQTKRAKVKRTRGGSYISDEFPLEVHKYGGTTYVVGYVSRAHKSVIERDEAGSIELWMRPVLTKGARSVAEVALPRIVSEKSLGLGVWGGACRGSPWNLELKLKSSSGALDTSGPSGQSEGSAGSSSVE